MKKSGLYQVGTILRFKKPVSIIVFKEETVEEHIIEPGIQCVISELSPPKVDVVGDEKILRVELDPQRTPWADYFDVVSFKHLRVIK